MARRYFKRYRMEYDLERQEPAAAVLPPGFGWVDWNDCELTDHAVVNFRAFQGGIDAEVFPSLASFDGCHRLMQMIGSRVDLVPRATWLIVSQASTALGPIAVGSIQTVSPVQGRAAVQNIGIVPEFRGCGLGKALIRQALIGMRSQGFRTATLEVTARNQTAVAIYERLGFRRTRTSYRFTKIPKQKRALV